MTNVTGSPGAISTGQIEKWIEDSSETTTPGRWNKSYVDSKICSVTRLNDNLKQYTVAAFVDVGDGDHIIASQPQNFIPLCREVIELRAENAALQFNLKQKEGVENAQARILLERAYTLMPKRVSQFNPDEQGCEQWLADFESFQRGVE